MINVRSMFGLVISKICHSLCVSGSRSICRVTLPIELVLAEAHFEPNVTVKSGYS